MDDETGKTNMPAYLTGDRLASLSDTMFGVAMTLVVTTLLPSIQAHRDDVLDMLSNMKGELITVLISFAISARYWVTQQQRLAMSKSVTSRQTQLHLVFLFLIVLVPITTSLPGITGSHAARGAVLIYGAHLTLIALINLLLWVAVHRGGAVAHAQIVQSSLAVALFTVGVAVGAVWPGIALYIWLLVLVVSPLGRYLTRRIYK